jgi:hypothetical protein
MARRAAAPPVTLTGTGLTVATKVSFGGQPVTARTATPDGTHLTVTAPAHAAGVVDVTASANGKTAALTHAYTYTATPEVFTVSGLRPRHGSTRGGTRVTITGTLLKRSAIVRFGRRRATHVRALSHGRRLTVRTPAHRASRVTVTVREGVHTRRLKLKFRYIRH